MNRGSPSDGRPAPVDPLHNQFLQAAKARPAGTRFVDRDKPGQAVADLPVQLNRGDGFGGERRGFAENDLVYQAVDGGGGAGGACLGGVALGGQFAGASAQGGEASQGGGKDGFIGGRRGWGGGQSFAPPESRCERVGVLAHGERLGGVEPLPQVFDNRRSVALGGGGAVGEVDGAGGGIRQRRGES